MVERISPNEFRNFVVSSFRMFVNNKTLGGRKEIATRIIKFCDDVFKKNSSSAVALSPVLQEALLFVVNDFSANTDVMSVNMEREMLRIIEELI